MSLPAASRTPSSLRVAGGVLKGRRLPVASGVRPTGSRLREALFSIWQHRVEDCLFLDLFAGSGAVGLEAISRGAARATLVEGSPRVFRILRRSAEELGRGRARPLRARLPGGLDRLEGEGFDLIFADPPYACDPLETLLQRSAPRLAAGGEMAIEHSSRLQVGKPPAPWRLRDRRCYGDSCLSFFALRGAQDERGSRP